MNREKEKKGDSVVKMLMIFFKMKLIGYCNINDLSRFPLSKTEINTG